MKICAPKRDLNYNKIEFSQPANHRSSQIVKVRVVQRHNTGKMIPCLYSPAPPPLWPERSYHSSI